MKISIEFSKYLIWFGAILFAFGGLYPLQKFIIKKSNSQQKKLLGERVMAVNQYQINAPDQTFNLPTKLDEISGLSLTDTDSLIVGIQDEKGKLYFINKFSGELIRDAKFAGEDDYEGVELLDGKAYITNSKGDIDIYDLNAPDEKAKTIKTFLKSDHDVEGLGYWPEGPSLLVACKSVVKKKDRNRKVYRFDPTTLKLDSVPFLVLDNARIAEALGRESITPLFGPSAITVHPASQEIFIISSPARALLVLDRDGTIKSATTLDRRVHRQPEGMVIDPRGVLYIANEAQEGIAKLHRFNPL